MSTGNQQSNDARHRYQYQSSTINTTISTRNHRVSNRPIHPNTTRPPPLQVMTGKSPVNNNQHQISSIHPSNHNNQNRRIKRKRKSDIWKYLESRKGGYCYLTGDITAHGIPIPKDTIAIVEQEDEETMPYLSFAKPYSNYRWTNGIKKAKLSFGMYVS